jgi:toxin ParE1/3/4
MKVVFLRSAERDLQELKRYIVKNFGEAVWLSSYGKLKKSVAAIQARPRMGRIPPELERLNTAQYRQVLSGMNRLIHEVRGETVYIHVVCDTRPDFQSLLIRRIVGS